MVEVITRENAHLYGDLLHDMFKMRYRVAVGEWGWTIPGIRPGYDKDAYDRDDTIHFVFPDVSGTRALGCARLNPTMAPHMLSDIFAARCVTEALPRAENIYEFSRYIVDHGATSKETLATVRARIAPAINKFCLHAGITHLTFLGYMSSYARTVKYWDTRPLGPPCYFEEDDATYIAAVSSMTQAGLENMQSAFSLGGEGPHLSSRLSWGEHQAVTRIKARLDQATA